MDRLELSHHCQASQLEGIVFVGFTFHVLEKPGIFVGTTDDRWYFQFITKVVDPAAGAASLNHDKIGILVLKQAAKVAFFSLCLRKAVFFRTCFVEAAPL